ncbi:MAG: hypothetical protein ACFCUM_05140 [Bacteroidales bacterium]
MIINRENYEAFLLDLMEGNLSVDQENILRRFLKENPDLNVEDIHTDLRLPDNVKIPVSGISFPMKEELKKGGLASEINAGNYEQFCIARLEGDLSAHSVSRLDKFLSENPGFGKSAGKFVHTILKADKSVIFPDKNALRKGTAATVTLKDYINRRFIYRTVSIAASLAIMLSLFNLVSDNSLTDQAINQGNRNEIINQSTDSGTQAVPDISPERTTVATDNVTVREFRETSMPGTSVPVPSVTRESEREVSHQLAIREPVLLPAHNISGVEIKAIRTDYSFELVRPLMMASNHREQEIRENERSGAGMILNGLLAFATRNVDGNEESAGLNLWNIADAGFKGINSLTGAELRLEREFNQEGELVSMEFSSRVIEFRRSTSDRDN